MQELTDWQSTDIDKTGFILLFKDAKTESTYPVVNPKFMDLWPDQSEVTFSHLERFDTSLVSYVQDMHFLNLWTLTLTIDSDWTNLSSKNLILIKQTRIDT